jgi:NADH-ubiquinone oxidoreductase chain 6
MGGLIVLFIYISRLASNESISLELRFIPLKTLPLISLLAIYLIIIFNTQIFKESNLASRLNIVFKVYSPNIIFITSITIIYLLLALIIIVKITTLKEGALRNLK